MSTTHMPHVYTCGYLFNARLLSAHWGSRGTGPLLPCSPIPRTSRPLDNVQQSRGHSTAAKYLGHDCKSHQSRYMLSLFQALYTHSFICSLPQASEGSSIIIPLYG